MRDAGSVPRAVGAIQTGHGVTRVQCALDEVRPDESGRTGNEDPHVSQSSTTVHRSCSFPYALTVANARNRVAVPFRRAEPGALAAFPYVLAPKTVRCSRLRATFSFLHRMEHPTCKRKGIPWHC